MAKAFRKMNLELTRKLRREEYEEIVYLCNLPTPDAANFHLGVLSLLESNGHVFPGKVDQLESILTDIHRLDLLPIVTRYKESKEYEDARKRPKGRKRGEKVATEADDLEPQLSELTSMSSEEKGMVKSLYTLLITRTTELMQILDILCEVLGKEEGAMEQFQEVAKDGEEFAENLHQVFRSMGITSRWRDGSLSSEDTPTTTGTETSMELAVGFRNLLKYGCKKKPAPLPRMNKPTNRTPQEEADDGRNTRANYGPIRQEEGFSGSPLLEPRSTPTLPHEDIECKPGDNAETGQDDSGIALACDWTGQSALSMDDLLESGSYEHGDGSVYMALLPRGKDAIYTSISHKTGCTAVQHHTI